MQKRLQQLASYGFGGGLAFILTTFTLTFLTERVHWHYLIAAIVGYGLGFIVNFIFQSWVTFRTGRNRFSQRLFRFALIQAFGFVLFVGLLAFLTETIRLHYFVAYLVTTVVTFALNFTLSKRFAFAALPTTPPTTSALLK